MTSSDSSIPDDVEGSPCSGNWRKEKACYLCETPLGHGLLRSKKHGCKFCFHAVCDDCSPNRKINQRTGKEQRICNFCEEVKQQDDREFRRAVTNLDILAETEEKLKLETALRQSVECKYAVTEATREKKAKELENVLERAEEAEKKAEELTFRLMIQSEKAREMEAFLREMAETALGRPFEGQEIGEEIAQEVLIRLKALLSQNFLNQPAKSSQIASCESVEVISKPKRRVLKPNSVSETIEIASIIGEFHQVAQLSLNSTSLSLPAVTHSQDTVKTIRKSDPSGRVQSHIQANKSCSSAPGSILPCAHCEELTAEVSKLRMALAQIPRGSRTASKAGEVQSSQACQCIIT